MPGPGPDGAVEFGVDLSTRLICPECREEPANLTEEFSSGDIVCTSCGLVLCDRVIDTRSEWRTFSNDDDAHGSDPNRVGEVANSLQDDEGLRTQVDTRAAGGSAKLAAKLHSTNRKSQSDKVNNDLQDGYRTITNMVNIMQAGSQVGQGAMHIYKLAYENGQLKGKPKEAVLAGCVFIACRQCGEARTFREVFAITQVPKKEIAQVFKSLEAFLNKIQAKHPQAMAIRGVQDYKSSASTSAEELCTRYCALLRFANTPRVEKVAKALACKTPSIDGLSGRSPLSVAAVCIYFASHYLEDPKSSKEISSVVGVSDGTIKMVYRFLYLVKDSLVEADWDGNMKKLPRIRKA